jgi:hypothetical protein
MGFATVSEKVSICFRFFTLNKSKQKVIFFHFVSLHFLSCSLHIFVSFLSESDQVFSWNREISLLTCLFFIQHTVLPLDMSVLQEIVLPLEFNVSVPYGSPVLPLDVSVLQQPVLPLDFSVIQKACCL